MILVYKGNKYPGLVFTVHLTHDYYPSELINISIYNTSYIFLERRYLL